MTLLLAFNISAARAAPAPELRMQPEKTIIRFIAKQSGAAVEGRFADVSGQISFDPDNLAGSAAHIEIKPASITSSDSNAMQELPSAAWFDVAHYPLALFECKDFVRMRDNDFEARGTLTIRGHSEPMTLAFTLIRYDDAGAEIEGETLLRRTAFGLGQGEWKETGVVADEVVVNVNVTAERITKE